MLDLSLTAEQQGQLAEWHAFAEEVIRPVVAEHDRDESTPMEVLEEASRRGLYSLDFWAAGLEDPTGLHWLLANEELFWGCAGIALQLTVSGLALAGLSAAGTPEQLMQWAPECFGSPGDIKLGALAVTEPTGGSEVASLTTTARRDGFDWVLDGTRCSSATVGSPTCTSSWAPWTLTSGIADRRPSSYRRAQPAWSRSAACPSWAFGRPIPASSGSRAVAFLPTTCSAVKTSSTSDSTQQATTRTSPGRPR